MSEEKMTMPLKEVEEAIAKQYADIMWEYFKGKDVISELYFEHIKFGRTIEQTLALVEERLKKEIGVKDL